MGWFEHGSTIIVFAPAGFALCDGVREGYVIRMGQPLLRLRLTASGGGSAAGAGLAAPGLRSGTRWSRNSSWPARRVRARTLARAALARAAQGPEAGRRQLGRRWHR